MKINHIDIKSGLWDHRLPPHEDRLAWIERVPFTWLPELISASIRESIIRGKFTPEEIIDFCKSAAESSGAREDTPLDQITDATSRRLPY